MAYFPKRFILIKEKTILYKMIHTLSMFFFDQWIPSPCKTNEIMQNEYIDMLSTNNTQHTIKMSLRKCIYECTDKPKRMSSAE